MRLKLIFFGVLIVGVLLLQPIATTTVEAAPAARSEGCRQVHQVGGPHTFSVGENQMHPSPKLLKEFNNLPFKKGEWIHLQWRVYDKAEKNYPSQGALVGGFRIGPSDTAANGDGNLYFDIDADVKEVSFKAQVLTTLDVRMKAWHIRFWIWCYPAGTRRAELPPATDEGTVVVSASPSVEPTTEVPTTTATIEATTEPPAPPTSQPTAEVTPPPPPTIEPTTEPTTEPPPPPPTEPITEAAPVETAQPAE